MVSRLRASKFWGAWLCSRDSQWWNNHRPWSRSSQCYFPRRHYCKRFEPHHLNRSLEVKVGQPLTCLHWLKELHGSEHFHIYVVLNDELTLWENLLEGFSSLLVVKWGQVILIVPFSSLVWLRTFPYGVFPPISNWRVSLGSTSFGGLWSMDHKLFLHNLVGFG